MLVVATAMAALLLVLFAEVVSFMIRLVSYDTYVAFCHVRDDNFTDFETDGFPEGR